ncbi:RNA polymerase sigma-70 factor [Chitinophaga varians]|uniref:RNA polymerase sigma-70 factor n=1 Tax=Chitinophaga varians TaxID=2202339 RepID=UPI00165EF459|nr:RNA polymerase sigma-70 factor [Chitinophaga varians]MBC9914292.1 RNA polymerase sigma-70 factor [Chitinophaga varians]
MKEHRPPSDADMMMSLRGDNGRAFADIYNRYWKTLLAIAFHHCKDKVIAEEIVQEVFISLWNRRKDQHIDSLEAYLATAVRLSVFKHILRQKRRTQIMEQTAAPAASSQEEEKIYTRLLQQQINGIVETLPTQCRLVFRLSRTEGLSIPEIAHQMGIAGKTAEAHLTKALKVLKLKLNRHCLWIPLLLPLFIS